MDNIKEPLVLKRTVPVEHHSKEGLLSEGGRKGKVTHDDSWMHNDIEELEVIQAINRKYSTYKPDNVDKSLYVDLEKGRMLNKTKLVKKRVPVRGKNGKIFYRMQWVDPSTGQPPSEHHNAKQEPTKKPRMKVSEEPRQPHHKEQSPDPEVTKKKEYDLTTREGQVEKFVDNLSKQEKEKLLEKYGIKWDKHDHPMKDWMNAIMALKRHVHDNPHIAGAEHLPQGGSKGVSTKPSSGSTVTPEGTNVIQDFINNTPREELYELCKQAGIAQENPYDNEAYVKKGTADIRHLNNMGKLKAYLKDNPHLMDKMRSSTPATSTEPSKPPVTRSTPGSQPTSKSKSAAQKGGNTIMGILQGMTSDQQYRMMKAHGIAEEDPRLKPGWQSVKEGGNGKGPISHMNNMCKLKALIEKDPSILNYEDADKTVLSQDEQDRISNMDTKQQLTNKVKEFLGNASKQVKKDFLHEFADNPLISGRKRYDDPNKDWMESMISLRKVFEQDTDLMEDYKDWVENDQLMRSKITNHQMEKILRKLIGLRGEYVQVRQVEKYKEWNFGNDNNPSFARIDLDDDGQAILSIVDTGESGDDWNQYDYPLKDIHSFLGDLKTDTSEKPQTIEVPLHEKNIIEIEKALQQNFNKNYTAEVGEKMKPHLASAWRAVNKSNSLTELCRHTHRMGKGTVADLLRKWGVPMSTTGDHFDQYSNAWKKIAYGHMVDSSKKQDANMYLIDSETSTPITGKDGKVDTWVLHESAKQWTPEERAEARKDLIGNSLDIQHDSYIPDKQGVRNRLTHHFHKSTEFVPFDLFSDVMAQGLKIKFLNTEEDGSRYAGNMFTNEDNSIHMNHSYIRYEEGLSQDDPFLHKPRADEDGIAQHSFSTTVSHEFAHALDHFFSGHNGYLNWNSELAKKYVGEKHLNCVTNSYDEAVNKSNPEKQLAKYESEVQPYFYHKDEWINSYEARIYGTASDPTGVEHLPKNADGTRIDSEYGTTQRGLEHWSMNVARYAEAFHGYKQMKVDNPQDNSTMAQWASSSYKGTRELGYGSDYEANRDGLKTIGVSARRNMPSMTAGYDYAAMIKYHKSLSTAIHHIFNRGDFLGTRGQNKPTQLHESGEYSRKSVDLLLKL